MPIVSVDFESDNTTGLGLSYYHPNFRITSCSFLVGDEAHFSTDIDEIEATLKSFVADGYTLLVYNASFDCAIMRHVFGIKNAYDISIDAWRLFNYCLLEVGDKHAKTKRRTSLPAAVEHFFNVANYKKPFLDKIIEMGIAKDEKSAHASIAQLPEDMLCDYNNLDTIWCYKVYEECIKRLTKWDIDWRPDHSAYMNECRLYSDAYIRGIKVDRALLDLNIKELNKKIVKVEKEIRVLPEVREVEAKLNKPIALTKHMVRKWKELKELPKDAQLSEEQLQQVIEWQKDLKWVKFNFASSHHKRLLFIDILKYPVIKPTNSGAPCMSKAVMKEYKETGKLFATYQNLSKQLEECQKIEFLSREDSRLHCSLRSGSTVTSRSSSKAD